MAPKARRGRPRAAKRSQSDRETEPVTKRQKLIDESFDFIDVDPVSGDLMIIFESHKTAYNVDSNAIQRASPVLYEKCLAVRPADGSNWTFKHEGWPETSKESAKSILHLIHANMDQISEALGFATVYNIFVFAIQYEMFDRYYISLKQWYETMSLSKREKTRNCCRLWLAHKLEHRDFGKLQKWAIFNLFDDGKGGLGDPSEEVSTGTPLDLAGFSLSDKTVIGRISRLRSEAVHLILGKLREVQLAMISTGDRPTFIAHGHQCSVCNLCLDRWFRCLSRGLLQPKSVNSSLGQTFPSLFPMIGAGVEEYHQPLKKLYAFIKSLQDQMKPCEFLSMTSKCVYMMEKDPFDRKSCSPPQIVSQGDVENLINAGLENV